MDEGIRLLFKRVLDGEPAVPAGEMAREARVAGRRLRRRRRGLAVGAVAGVIAVLAGVLAVATTPQPASDTTPLGNPTPVPRPVAMMMVDPACTFPAYNDATVAVIFLRVNVTDQQRRDLDATVRSDRRVRGVRFESAQDAYDRFARLYADAPDLVGSVKIDQVPESFLVEHVEPSP
jgi:hypothetical protein